MPRRADLVGKRPKKKEPLQGALFAFRGRTRLAIWYVMPANAGRNGRMVGRRKGEEQHQGDKGAADQEEGFGHDGVGAETGSTEHNGQNDKDDAGTKRGSSGHGKASRVSRQRAMDRGVPGHFLSGPPAVKYPGMYSQTALASAELMAKVIVVSPGSASVRHV